MRTFARGQFGTTVERRLWILRDEAPFKKWLERSQHVPRDVVVELMQRLQKTLFERQGCRA